MSTKMLIDATHPEETRVVVVRDGQVEDFDFEAASRKQLRGNIYLAKVTRVEPSLQAAFVDYGGNRHGFLAFSEIHPDYYQIPMPTVRRCSPRTSRGRAPARHGMSRRADAAEVARPRPTETARTPRTPMPSPGRETPASDERSNRSAASDALEEVPERRQRHRGRTRSRKSSSAGRCCWCRSSRKSAATRARR